ncbi:SPOR domain-containing protein [Pelomicrobium methylotrophicum]|uniref:SPOR domain-containing protein n=1 Tax=Pelomicrobium methylotrophicum TaxID=2602750 RepID=A0A5C7EJ94_9PROT|nr:SPOR domain-containing protein [Pelomicrobium methylotrophicum]TXF11026.1 SPOR domain-containing protein [Pelomicrobium methylotrophicum]
MARDYKHVHSRGSRRGSSLLAGIVIGLVLGLAIALGVAWYLNRGPSPFVAGSKPSDTAPPSAVRGLPQQAAPSESPAKAEARPRFEFYKILPGKEEAVTPQELKQQATTRPTKDVYYLQAGAFQNAADADNLKAKLALTGLEASVQTATLPDRGTWHRVRVGPYRQVEEVNRAQAMLKQQGIDAVLIRVNESGNP